MFNAERNETYGVSVDDPITYTLTTKGFLSDGCSHPVTINGGYGNDTFDVLRNKCVLDLNGDSDNDSFVVRSFAAPEILPDGSLGNKTFDVSIKVCDPVAENSEEEFTCGDNTIAIEAPADPDYLVNSLVDIDGGTGIDRLTIVGTEFGDKYVIDDGKIFGGGLTVKFTNINYLDVAGLEGDDEFYVLSTNPSLLLSLYGSLGSDTFFITPESVKPVISKNLRGHRGIFEHLVSSSDPHYMDMKVRGVQCDVLDNDGDFGYVSVVDQGGFHLMTEDGDGSFSFFVYPTTRPVQDVVVNIVAPAALDENRYVLVNGGDSAILNFTADKGLLPQEVTVTYNPNVVQLDITEKNLMLKILVDLDGGNTKDERFIQTEQSLIPVDIRLIPSVNNTNGAKSVSIVERLGGLSVMEGMRGFNTSYDVYVRPCSLANDIKITMDMSVANQLILNKTVLTSSDFENDECKAVVEVAAFDDGWAEGDHYVNIQHFVSTSDGIPINLTDNSILFASNVLIHVYDDDTGGVIIRESNGITAVAEMNEEENDHTVSPQLFTDEYFIRLTREPDKIVQIDIASIAVATDYDSIFTPPGRNFTVRTQINVNGSESATLIFTKANWFDEVLVIVTAIDDDIEEGVDLLNFASKPSNLVSGINLIASSFRPLLLKSLRTLNVPGIDSRTNVYIWWRLVLCSTTWRSAHAPKRA
jgi:hypothetical protein